MYLGFTKNKVLLVFLLLGCVFASLALSQVSFEKVYMEGLEGNDDQKQAPIKCTPPKLNIGKISIKNIKKLPNQLKKVSGQLKQYVKCTNKQINRCRKHLKELKRTSMIQPTPNPI